MNFNPTSIVLRIQRFLLGFFILIIIDPVVVLTRRRDRRTRVDLIHDRNPILPVGDDVEEIVTRTVGDDSQREMEGVCQGKNSLVPHGISDELDLVDLVEGDIRVQDRLDIRLSFSEGRSIRSIDLKTQRLRISCDSYVDGTHLREPSTGELEPREFVHLHLLRAFRTDNLTSCYPETGAFHGDELGHAG